MYLIIKNFFKAYFPKIFKIVKILFNRDNVNAAQFEGWGLTTIHAPPWIGVSKNKTFKEFNRCEEILFKKVKEKKFILPQLINAYGFNYSNNESKLLQVLKSLRFRHYNIFFSSLYAYNNTKNNNIVECGVCDGLSVFFAIHKYKESPTFKVYLYDAWDNMNNNLLTDREMKSDLVNYIKGKYAHLDIKNTKKNLKDYNKNSIFNKGYIPEVFNFSNNPDQLSWLHIDLNTSLSTKSSLEFFFPKLEKHGVILFDDYGQDLFKDTRRIIENFLENKNGDFFHLATGQAMFIKY